MTPQLPNAMIMVMKSTHPVNIPSTTESTNRTSDPDPTPTPTPSSISTPTSTSTPTTPCGLYVHIPFCETKCGYCDFYSVALKDRDTSPLVRRIIEELTSRVEDWSHPLHTIFCGGGTPTLLPIKELRNLLTSLGTIATACGVREFTVEANPATVDDAKATLLVEHGVNRVSMGAQSFFVDELATLERIHSPDDIAPSVQTLRRAGVSQINLDLIFGIPGQTLDTWRESLKRAIDLGPDHLACYGLTYEPATRLTAMRDHGRITPCEENLEAEQFLCTMETLAAAGFEQYEISNFAQPGCQSQHNLIYWRNQNYIGVGPSAAGCLDGRRYKNIADIAGYVRLMDEGGRAEMESESLDPQTLVIEMVMMQLRLNEGLSIEAFKQRTGSDPRVIFAEPLERFSAMGLLQTLGPHLEHDVTLGPHSEPYDDTHIALTHQGRLLADAVIVELVSAIDKSPKSLRVLSNSS